MNVIIENLTALATVGVVFYRLGYRRGLQEGHSQVLNQVSDLFKERLKIAKSSVEEEDESSPFSHSKMFAVFRGTVNTSSKASRGLRDYATPNTFAYMLAGRAFSKWSKKEDHFPTVVTRMKFVPLQAKRKSSQ